MSTCKCSELEGKESDFEEDHNEALGDDYEAENYYDNDDTKYRKTDNVYWKSSAKENFCESPPLT